LPKLNKAVQATRGSLKKASLGSNAKDGAMLEDVAGVFANIMDTVTNDKDLKRMLLKTVMKHENGRGRDWGRGRGMMRKDKWDRDNFKDNRDGNKWDKEDIKDKWGKGNGGRKMETSQMAADHIDKFLNMARRMVKEGKGKDNIGIQAANCAYSVIWGEKPKGKLCNALSNNTRTQLASVVSSLLKQEQMRKPVINLP
jgi:hypothetical protein